MAAARLRLQRTPARTPTVARAPLPAARRRLVIVASGSEILHPELPRVSVSAIADSLQGGNGDAWRVLDVREPEVRQLGFFLASL